MVRTVPQVPGFMTFVMILTNRSVCSTTHVLADVDTVVVIYIAIQTSQQAHKQQLTHLGEYYYKGHEPCEPGKGLIRAVISILTCTSMASNSMSDSEYYWAIRIQVRVLLLP